MTSRAYEVQPIQIYHLLKIYKPKHIFNFMLSSNNIFCLDTFYYLNKFVVTTKDLNILCRITMSCEKYNRGDLVTLLIKAKLSSHKLSDSAIDTILAIYDHERVLANIKFAERAMLDKQRKIDSVPVFVNKAIIQNWALA